MTHKLSYLGYLISALIIGGSIWRWYGVWYDPSQAVFGTGIGILLGILSYVYSFMRDTDAKIDKLDRRLNSLVAWEFKAGEEHLKEEIKGIDNS